MKKIMILGAGVYQVPLILKAKEMGLYTIVVSIPGNYPGFDLADKIYYEDTADYEKVLEIARSENIDGIVTAGTDVAVITVGKVCDEMGLCGLSFEAAQIAANKLLMKEQYEKYGVRTARFRKISFRDEQIQDKLAELKAPLIFKAVDSSGSRGIIRVDYPEQFQEIISKVKGYTKKDYFIVEEFLEGEEFGAQAFVLDGEVRFILPHGDYVFQGETGVPVGHWVPFELSDNIIEDAKHQLQLAAEAMKLDNCAMNVDFILVDGKTYVLEIGGRSGATCLSEMVSTYYQFDYYEKMLEAALGEKPDFSSDCEVPCAAMLLYSDTEGLIVSQTDQNPIDEDIIEIQFDHNIGDAVSRFRIGPHRIGHVIVKAGSVDQAVKKLDQVINNIEIKVK
ncbi:MAG: ATP-grasp domain-containing protein [Eubacterium sp.]|nr:ATP-grasp domain-containing protein [Eubacterium sp.]